MTKINSRLRSTIKCFICQYIVFALVLAFIMPVRTGMAAHEIVSFLDDFSFRVRKDTFVVLDNATVHRNKLVKERRPIWENRGLFLFFLPPYSPHLNIAETLWRILKGKWIRPQDYTSTDTLFYATNRALADIGNGLRIM